ncbi:hypothetical protein [Paenibacillus sp. MBLB4367]|uniref:hypothetical protein n=1 Tax=Paenibacillus sp. MBLB4367 TaxID=3384767 RepID=UPI00390838F9
MLKRSYLYFFSAFVGVGLQNVIPQLMFGRIAPEREETLLASCLMLGAAASLATLFIRPGTIWNDGKGGMPQILLQGSVILVLFFSLFYWQQAAPFIVAFALLRFVIQALYDRTDHRYAAMTTPEERLTYARWATLFQLIGIMTGPVLFTLTAHREGLNAAIAVVMTVILVGTIAAMPNERTGLPVSKELTAGQERGSDPGVSPYSFLAYVLTAAVAVQLFAANAIYLVRDYFHVPNAVLLGGILLTAMNAAGIAAVLLQPWAGAKLKLRVRAAGSPWQAAVMLASVLLMQWPLSRSYAYLLVLGIATGAAYGLFWMRTREAAVNIGSYPQHAWVLTVYNNINNVAVLCAAALAAIAALSSQDRDGYLQGILIVLAACFAISSALAIRLQNRSNQTEKRGAGCPPIIREDTQ